MPGKQMAIDADLNAGILTSEEAKERRKEIEERNKKLGNKEDMGHVFHSTTLINDPKFKDLQAQGFSRVLVDGEIIRLDEAKRLDRYFNHDISVVIDRIKIKKTPGRRLPQSVETALELTFNP